MSEKRYSFATCAKAIGITASSIQYRARKLRIDSSKGISAEELLKIKNYESIREKYNKNSLAELQEEMRALK